MDRRGEKEKRGNCLKDRWEVEWISRNRPEQKCKSQGERWLAGWLDRAITRLVPRRNETPFLAHGTAHRQEEGEESGNVKRKKKKKKKRKRKSIWRSWRWWGKREKNSLISLVVSHRHTDRPLHSTARTWLHRRGGGASLSPFSSFFRSPRRKVGSALIIVNQTRERRAERRPRSAVVQARARAIIVEIAENPPDKRVHERAVGRERKPRTAAANREISTDRITTRRYFRAFPCPVNSCYLRRRLTEYRSGRVAKFLDALGSRSHLFAVS